MLDKSQQNFEQIAEAKNRFMHLSSEIIALRLCHFGKANAITIAYKQILKDRGIDDFLSFLEQKDGDK